MNEEQVLTAVSLERCSHVANLSGQMFLSVVAAVAVAVAGAVVLLRLLRCWCCCYSLPDGGLQSIFRLAVTGVC